MRIQQGYFSTVHRQRTTKDDKAFKKTRFRKCIFSFCVCTQCPPRCTSKKNAWAQNAHDSHEKHEFVLYTIKVMIWISWLISWFLHSNLCGFIRIWMSIYIYMHVYIHIYISIYLVSIKIWFVLKYERASGRRFASRDCWVASEPLFQQQCWEEQAGCSCGLRPSTRSQPSLAQLESGCRNPKWLKQQIWPGKASIAALESRFLLYFYCYYEKIESVACQQTCRSHCTSLRSVIVI